SLVGQGILPAFGNQPQNNLNYYIPSLVGQGILPALLLYQQISGFVVSKKLVIELTIVLI
ncbi:MAG: hypothetical protein ACKO9G_09060, partial [Dolichospermum sp.]